MDTGLLLGLYLSAPHVRLRADQYQLQRLGTFGGLATLVSNALSNISVQMSVYLFSDLFGNPSACLQRYLLLDNSYPLC